MPSPNQLGTKILNDLCRCTQMILNLNPHRHLPIHVCIAQDRQELHLKETWNYGKTAYTSISLSLVFLMCSGMDYDKSQIY